MEQSARVRQHSAPAIRARSAERGRWHTSVPPAQRPAVVGGLSQGTYSGFKVAVAVIVFHFGVKMLVQFADILLPFIMALLLCTVLEPVKQVTLEVLECTLIVLFQRVSCCGCCLRRVRRETLGGEASDSGATPASGVRGSRTDLHELMKRFLLLVSITITVLLAGRLFWLVGRVVWLSGEAVTHDFPYYRSGVEKRGSQVQHLLKRFHLQNQAHVDMEHIGHWALRLLQYSAEFLTQHVFYTLTQISLTTIFVLFLLYSPVQRDFSPVMRVVFESMELYLKLKTLISMTMGVTNGIALAIIGLELPAAWGLLTFLANFIPNIGGPVMSILPCVIALLDVRKSFYQVSAAFLAQFFLHFNIANFVEPVVFGTTEEIHSVVVLLGLSFFGYIWGFTGMFLSVPMLFAIHAWLKTVAQSVNCAQEARDDARFIMGILEGRWLAAQRSQQGEAEALAQSEELSAALRRAEGAAAAQRPCGATLLLGEERAALASSLATLDAVHWKELRSRPRIADSHAEIPGCEHVLIAASEFAKSLAQLQALKVRYLLCVDDTPSTLAGKLYRGVGIKEHKILRLEDSPTHNVLEQLQAAHLFMDRAQEEHCKVLVHSAGGVNRAGAVVLSYMVRRSHQKGPRRPSWGQEVLQRQLASLASVWWPVLQQASFRLQLLLWCHCDFEAQRAREHPLWAPLLFRCLTAERIRARRQLGKTEEEVRAKLEMLVDLVMFKEARLQKPFALDTPEERDNSNMRLQQFLSQKYS